jgi:hypothetical protein
MVTGPHGLKDEAWAGGATEAVRRAKAALRLSPMGAKASVARIDTTETPKKLVLAILKGEDWGNEEGVIWTGEAKSILHAACPGCCAPTMEDCVC